MSKDAVLVFPTAAAAARAAATAVILLLVLPATALADTAAGEGAAAAEGASQAVGIASVIARAAAVGGVASADASGPIALAATGVAAATDLGLWTGWRAAQVESSGTYSTNAICSQRNCVNPVFPGYLQLTELEATSWQCEANSKVRGLLKFCDDVVYYDVAVPAQNTSVALASLVEAQEARAVETYFYHLAALNMNAWEYRHVRGKRGGNACTEAIRAMACHTFLPKAEAGCSNNAMTKYERPCKNVCTNYVKACGVECCDESVKCVHERKVSFVDGTSQVRSGYADALGPSATCTGAASRRAGVASSLRAWLLATLLLAPLAASPAGASLAGGVWGAAAREGRRASASAGLSRTAAKASVALALVAVAASLQGCEMVPHSLAAWQMQPNYFVNFEIIPEGKPMSEAVLNSCEQADTPKEKQCSGHGVCKQWNATTTHKRPMLFCECSRGWADPECRTRRKSQSVAFALSVFLGPFGADRFYMGELGAGFAKMTTLGGFGIWWIYDMVRVGASPVYTSNFRLAYDLDHSIFVSSMVVVGAAIGYFNFGVLYMAIQRRKAKAKKLLQTESAFFMSRSATCDIAAEDRVRGMPVRQSCIEPRPVNVGIPPGYGATAVGNGPERYAPAGAAFPMVPPTNGAFAFGGYPGRIGDPAAAVALAQPVGPPPTPPAGTPHGSTPPPVTTPPGSAVASRFGTSRSSVPTALN